MNVLSRINTLFAVLITTGMVTTLGCAKGGHGPSHLQERIDAVNNVDRLRVPMAFITDPDQLPSSGSSSKAVWSGSWWPFSQGGTAEPMRKFDAATGNDGKAESWERRQAEQLGGTSWAGHCNGLAAAGINETEPQHAVTYGGQEFSVDDLKGLLVEKWQGVSQISLVGQRCNQPPQFDANGRALSGACRGINPGSLHVILGNMLGLRRQPFVLDIYPAEQIWNYPAVGYTTAKTEINAAAATALVGGGGGSYAFDPDATQFLQVHTVIHLARGHGDLTLDYVLEGKDGAIIGGEWFGDAKKNHPAFAWTTSQPESANPFLSVSGVNDIVKWSHD